MYPAQANFVYVRMPSAVDGVALRNRLLCEHGCLIREWGNELGSDSSHFRIAARPRDGVDHLVECLAESLNELERRAPARRRAGGVPLWGAR